MLEQLAQRIDDGIAIGCGNGNQEDRQNRYRQHEYPVAQVRNSEAGQHALKEIKALPPMQPTPTNIGRGLIIDGLKRGIGR